MAPDPVNSTESNAPFKKQKFRRSTILINKPIQVKYGLIMLAIFILATIVVWWQTYEDVSKAVEMGILEHGNMLSIVRHFNHMLLIKISIILVAVWVFSVFVLHLVAGPLFRIEASLKELQSGDLTKRMHLRKDDQLKNIASVFNETMENLQSKVKKDQDQLNDLAARLRKLAQRLDADAAREIDEINKELAKVISRFKV